MPVQTWNPHEIFPARLEKHFSSTNANLLNRLQTIGNKRRADHEQSFHTGTCKPLKLVFRGRSQPRVAAQSRLKSNGVLDGRNVCLTDEGFYGFETLGAVTRRMRRAGRFATVSCLQTMAASGISLFDLPLGHTVETEQQMIVTVVQIIRCAPRQCRD